MKKGTNAEFLFIAGTPVGKITIWKDSRVLISVYH